MAINSYVDYDRDGLGEPIANNNEKCGDIITCRWNLINRPGQLIISPNYEFCPNECGLDPICLICGVIGRVTIVWGISHRDDFRRMPYFRVCARCETKIKGYVARCELVANDVVRALRERLLPELVALILSH